MDFNRETPAIAKRLSRLNKLVTDNRLAQLVGRRTIVRETGLRFQVGPTLRVLNN